MNTQTKKAKSVAVLAIAICLSLGACKQDQQSGNGTNAASLTGTEAVADAPQQLVPEVVIGSYVDPVTMEVGGIDGDFSPSDKLFASLKFPAQIANTELKVSIFDSNGILVSEKTALVVDTSQSAANFDMEIPSAKSLPTGSYQLEGSINGIKTKSAAFEVK